jgi:hypothetical protein
MEESLNGNTSEPYLNAVETLASLYESASDNERAVRMLRQAVAIGDLVYSLTDVRRGGLRSRLALGLAREEQFDEAERVISDAIVIGNQLRPWQPEQFTPQLEMIRQMKAAASKSESAAKGQ